MLYVLVSGRTEKSVGAGAVVVVGVIRKREPAKKGDLYWKMGSK